MKLALELSLAFLGGSTFGMVLGVKLVHSMVGDLKSLNADFRSYAEKLIAKL